MFIIDSFGTVIDSRIKVVSYPIAHGDLGAIRGIIVHQTDSPTVKATFNAYKRGGNGAHFLIEKDGTIYQTLSLKKKAWHIGPLKSRCIETYQCSPTELQAALRARSKGVLAEHRSEMKKAVPFRYPSNDDSIGIEIVGKASGPKHQEIFEPVTDAQNASLKWLVQQLTATLKLSMSVVLRHPEVSRKNKTEASTANWK
jgi:N-acetyl-anhydromuramyl-L-alanine amidase AmpD